jgi:hypothetical protein
MKNKNTSYLLLIFMLTAFNACSNLKKAVGIEKEVPNEFLIEKRDPLIFPPDYNILPPGADNKVKQNEIPKNSLKNILDKNFNQKKEQSSESTSGNSIGIENEILKKIK